MIYLINTFNPHWEGHALPEWTWPKRRVFGYMLNLTSAGEKYFRKMQESITVTHNHTDN